MLKWYKAIPYVAHGLGFSSSIRDRQFGKSTLCTDLAFLQSQITILDDHGLSFMRAIISNLLTTVDQTYYEHSKNYLDFYR